MIASLGGVLVVLALVGAGVLWGLIRLAKLAVGLLQSGVTRGLGRNVGQAGAVGIGWGVSRFAGRFATPIMLWGLALVGGAVLIAIITWEMPYTVIALAISAVLAFLISRGIPNFVEGMIKRRLAKGLLHR